MHIFINFLKSLVQIQNEFGNEVRLTVEYVCMESVCMYGSKSLLLYFPILTQKYSNLSPLIKVLVLVHILFIGVINETLSVSCVNNMHSVTAPIGSSSWLNAESC